MSLSSIDKLPPEIIQEIFALCIQPSTRLLPPAEANTLNNNNITQVTQLAISHVCSKWRAIALSFPCLWNRFSLRFGPDDSDSRRTSILQLAELWLSRSEDTLIAMDIEVGHDYCHFLAGQLIRKIHSLISQHKFKALGGKSELIFPMFQDAESYKTSLSCVQSLKLTHTLGQAHADHIIQYDLPCLLSLDLDFLRCPTIHPFPWGAIFPMIPWHRLQRFKICGISCVEAAVDVLWQCRALVELDLSLHRWPQNEVGVLTNGVPLPNLRELKFDSTFLITDISTLMRVIDAPHLTRLLLKWSNPCPSSESHFDRLMAKLGTQFQQLHEFTICYPYEGLDIRPILKCMPSLRHLTLDAKIRLNQDTAKKISNGELGPCLKSMSISKSRDPELLLDTIEKRWRIAMGSNGSSSSISSFSRVTFSCTRSLYDRCREHAKRLEREHNIDINIATVIGHQVGARTVVVGRQHGKFGLDGV